MSNIDWARTGQAAVIVVLIGFLYGMLAVWVGRRLRDERERAEEECRKLALLVAIADEIEELPANSPDRRRLYREAEGLGFLDSDSPHFPDAA